jgi:hypothetical protein
MCLVARHMASFLCLRQFILSLHRPCSVRVTNERICEKTGLFAENLLID